MFPSFEFLGQTFGLYGICAVAGLGCCTLLFRLLYRQRQLDGFCLALSAVFALIGAFIGARLLYALTQLPAIISILVHWSDCIHSFGDFFAFLSFSFGGMVFYGGLLGGMAAAVIYLRRAKQPLSGYADLYAVGIPLFHVFGRLGCFFAGCCYGVESRFGFVTHASVAPAGDGVMRFPVQLLEAALLLCLFLLLLSLYRKSSLRGRLLGCYLLCYGVIRFAMEFLRGDTYRGFLLGLSTSQWISLLLIAAGCLRLLTGRKKHLPADAADA